MSDSIEMQEHFVSKIQQAGRSCCHYVSYIFVYFAPLNLNSKKVNKILHSKKVY